MADKFELLRRGRVVRKEVEWCATRDRVRWRSLVSISGEQTHLKWALLDFF